MRQKHLFSFLFILLLSLSQLAFAQDVKSREALVKKSIADLDSEDINVAAEAASRLGVYGSTEAVPRMLQVLKSSRPLRKIQHIMGTGKPTLSFPVSIDVRANS